MVIIDAVFCIPLPCGHCVYWITELFTGGGGGGREGNGGGGEMSKRWRDVTVERQDS